MQIPKRFKLHLMWSKKRFNFRFGIREGWFQRKRPQELGPGITVTDGHCLVSTPVFDLDDEDVDGLLPREALAEVVTCDDSLVSAISKDSGLIIKDGMKREIRFPVPDPPRDQPFPNLDKVIQKVDANAPSAYLDFSLLLKLAKVLGVSTARNFPVVMTIVDEERIRFDHVSDNGKVVAILMQVKR